MDKRLLKAKEKYEGKIFISNKGEKAKVIHYNGKYDVRIKFIKTGAERIVGSSHLTRGVFYDYERIVGNEYTNKRGHTYKVLKTKGEHSLVEFTNTGYTKWVTNTDVISLKVKDRFERDTCGVGYYGEPNTSLAYYTKARNLWNGMLTRCYSSNFRVNAKYTKPTVCERWLCLEYFLEDISKIKNFDRWLKEPMHLDKDLLGNSMTYNINTTIFLTPQENRDEQIERYNQVNKRLA